jgi:2'-5' RNA ligase
MTHCDESSLKDATEKEVTPSLRAFIALPLSEETQRFAAGLRDELQGQFPETRLRWVRPENLHLTLRFLGQLDLDRIPILAQHLKTEVANSASFSFRLTHPVVFPSPSRPRVIALGLEPPEPLERLAQAVERAVCATGLPNEARAFRPHITLARFPRKTRLTNLAGELEVEEITEQASEVVLFRSVLTSTGPVYSVLEKFDLRKE